MPPIFRRRRRAGQNEPNKNEKKVLRQQETERLKRSASLVGDLFPAVSRLSIRMDFMTSQQHSLEQHNRVFAPADACDFLVPCPGRCAGEGAFDLTDRIRSIVETHQQSGEESAVCQEPVALGSEDSCGLQMRCKIEASYQ